MDENKTIDTHNALIKKCKNNDRKAQFEVYKLYYKAMYNTSLRILNNTSEAEDAMQDGFLKAFHSINEFRFESNFGTWLKRIVINVSLDYLRRRKVVFQELTDKQSSIAYDENNAIFDEHELTIEKIKTIMSKLPDGYRAILSLYLFEGFDYDEISEIIGITPSTARSQFCRARKKLLEEIKRKINLQ